MLLVREHRLVDNDPVWYLQDVGVDKNVFLLLCGEEKSKHTEGMKYGVRLIGSQILMSTTDHSGQDHMITGKGTFGACTC